MKNIFDGETIGDDIEIECPACGKKMYIGDDQTWAQNSTDCEHCDSEIELSHSINITTTARVKKKPEAAK